MNEQLLDVLTRSGVLIKVSIRYWRGCKQLKAEDLGLNQDQVSDRLISLGHKRLLPKEALEELALVEGRAHALIEQNSFPFLNGLGHFLPNSKLEEVTGKLSALETSFWRSKQSFLQRYGQLREAAVREWRTMAGKVSAEPERLVSVIEASFPVAAQLERHFGFHTSLFQIALPESTSLQTVELADQMQVANARDRAVQEAQAKIRRDTEVFVSECVASLRQQTAQLCEEMLHSIDSSEVGVHQKTLNRLVKFIEQFKQLNFANDTVMDQQLEQVRRELLSRTAEEYRDSSPARNQLVQGLSRLRSKAKELAHQDAADLVARFGSLGRRKFNLAA